MPVEWKGDMKVLDGVTFQMYPAGCCEYGCASCCANSMFCFMTAGTYMCCAPEFTFTIHEDGKSGVGKNATMAGCLPMSPVPCCLCCGVGPCAFVSPFKVEDAPGGGKKWVGTGQVCSGGCCPCFVNTGDWGINDASTDGSTPEKYHNMYPVSPFWPPCVNGMCCGKDQPTFRLTQKGVGPPKNGVAPAGGPAAVEMSR